MALTALVTAQDDPERLKELNKETKSILNNYQEELPNVLRQVNGIFLTFMLRLFTWLDIPVIGHANL